MGRDSHSFVKLYDSWGCSKPFRFLFLSFADEMSRSVGESVPFFSGWRNSGGQQRIGEEEEEEERNPKCHTRFKSKKFGKTFSSRFGALLRD